MVDRQRLVDVFPDYVDALSDRLRDAGWGYLADSVPEVRIFGLAIGDDTCGLTTSSIPGVRSGALPIQLAEEMIEIKNDRIVYIEIRGTQPARDMLRELTAAAG